MELEQAVEILKVLGHPIRLAVFKRLVKAGHAGVPVGVIQSELNVPNSTLSHHISSLIAANLMTQNRVGRTLYCTPNFENLDGIIEYLREECCSEQSD